MTFTPWLIFSFKNFAHRRHFRKKLKPDSVSKNWTKGQIKCHRSLRDFKMPLKQLKTERKSNDLFWSNFFVLSQLINLKFG